ncbi:MAG: hypothetical protein D6805_07265 [Planctomycetota bacterium]|nr:MAG: hypothetical protein D6805_07265 [Planctomycetota bacterium]
MKTKKKSKRAAALIFTLFVLILLAGISLSLYKVSVSGEKLTSSFGDIRKGEFAAESGIRYFTSQILALEMQGKTPDEILLWLESKIGQKIYLGTNSQLAAWFKLVCYDKHSPCDVNSTHSSTKVGMSGEDFLLRVEGGSDEASVASASFLTKWLNVAYAAGDSVEFVAVVGPKSVDGSSGSGGFFSVLPQVEDNASIGSYAGSSSVLRLPSDAMAGEGYSDFQNALQDNVTVQPYEQDLSASIQSYIDGQLAEANDLMSGDNITITDVGKYEVKDSSYQTLGSKDSFSYYTGTKLELKDNAVLVLGPGVYNFSKLELKDNAKLILDTTNGPVYLNITAQSPPADSIKNKLKEKLQKFIQSDDFNKNDWVKKLQDKIKDAFKEEEAKLKIKDNSQLIVFKGQSTSPTTYEAKTDQANKDEPLGPNGQKIAKIFVQPLDASYANLKTAFVSALQNIASLLSVPTNKLQQFNSAITTLNFDQIKEDDAGKGEIKLEGSAAVGTFASGDQTALWNANSYSSSLLEGTGSEISGASSPTAGVLEMFLATGKKGKVELEDNATLNASLYISGNTDKVKVEMKDSSTLNGLFAMAGIQDNQDYANLRQIIKAYNVAKKLYKKLKKEWKKTGNKPTGFDAAFQAYQLKKKAKKAAEKLLKKVKIKIELKDNFAFNIDPNITLFPSPETLPNSYHVKMISRVN